MDFYTGSSTGDGLSLQDMIECDIRSNYSENVPSDHGDILGSQGSGGLASPGLTLDSYTLSEPVTETLHDATKYTWVPTVNLAQLQAFSPTENADPNLLVDPQTGVPVTRQIEIQQSVSASQTLTQVNTAAVTAHSGLLQTAQGHFITIPSHLQQAYLQQQQQQQQPTSPVHSSSPLRQHLQQPAQQASPVRVSHAAPAYILTNGTIQTVHSPSHKTHNKAVETESPSKAYPKPVYSYSCLIAMALKNCETGCLPVSEIYSFMTENFPYFKTAPDGWKNCVRHNLSLNKCFEKIEPPNTNSPSLNKNSVRHNLSLNKCFEKIENPRSNGNTKKGCLWAMNPAKIEKMEEEIAKWRKKDPLAIKRSMAKPENLEMLEKGQIGSHSPRPINIMPGSPGGPPTPTTPKSVAPPSAPTTPTTPSNNNNSKVLVRTLPNMSAVAAALANNTAQIQALTRNNPIAVIQTNGRLTPVSTPTVEIKQEFKPEVKVEVRNDELGLNNLTSEDLSILEHNLALDPSLGDMELQSNLFDDLGEDDLLGLDILPGHMSPLSFTLNTASLTASPLTVQAAAMPIKDEKLGVSALQTNFIYSNGTTLAPTTVTPKATLALSRTVSAHT